MHAGLTAPRRERLLFCGALGALVFFSRAWLVQTAGSPVPFWDQWDAEAVSLYLPWLNHTLHWSDLLQPHNEHRIVLTRLADLALFTGFDGWHPWAQLLFNGALHACTAAALAAVFWPALAPAGRASLTAGLAVIFAATCGWQNALWGFQSQVYFANILTVAALAGLCACPASTSGWWLGLGAAALALLAQGGGVLAAIAALVATGVIRWTNPNDRQSWRSVALIGLVVAAGLTLRTSAPWHASLQAKSVTQFFTVFAHCLAWPWVNEGALAAVMPFPLVWLMVRRRMARQPLDGSECAALALGLCAVLHAAAVAYSRGGGLPDARPLSRYQDPLLLGAAAQGFAALRLGAGAERPLRILLLLWGGLALAGLISLTETNLTLNLPYKRAQDRASLAMIQAYVATGDATVFAGDPAFTGPHPDPRVVQRVMDDPTLRPYLPAELRASSDGPATTKPWVIRHGAGLTAASAALLLGLMWTRLRSRQPAPDSGPSP